MYSGVAVAVLLQLCSLYSPVWTLNTPQLLSKHVSLTHRTTNEAKPFTDDHGANSNRILTAQDRTIAGDNSNLDNVVATVGTIISSEVANTAAHEPLHGRPQTLALLAALDHALMRRRQSVTSETIADHQLLQHHPAQMTAAVLTPVHAGSSFPPSRDQIDQKAEDSDALVVRKERPQNAPQEPETEEEKASDEITNRETQTKLNNDSSNGNVKHDTQISQKQLIQVDRFNSADSLPHTTTPSGKTQEKLVVPSRANTSVSSTSTLLDSKKPAKSGPSDKTDDDQVNGIVIEGTSSDINESVGVDDSDIDLTEKPLFHTLSSIFGAQEISNNNTTSEQHSQNDSDTTSLRTEQDKAEDKPDVITKKVSENMTRTGEINKNTESEVIQDDADSMTDQTAIPDDILNGIKETASKYPVIAAVFDKSAAELEKQHSLSKEEEVVIADEEMTVSAAENVETANSLPQESDTITRIQKPNVREEEPEERLKEVDKTIDNMIESDERSEIVNDRKHPIKLQHDEEENTTSNDSVTQNFSETTQEQLSQESLDTPLPQAEENNSETLVSKEEIKHTNPSNLYTVNNAENVSVDTKVHGENGNNDNQDQNVVNDLKNNSNTLINKYDSLWETESTPDMVELTSMSDESNTENEHRISEQVIGERLEGRFASKLTNGVIYALEPATNREYYEKEKQSLDQALLTEKSDSSVNNEIGGSSTADHHTEHKHTEKGHDHGDHDHGHDDHEHGSHDHGHHDHGSHDHGHHDHGSHHGDHDHHKHVSGENEAVGASASPPTASANNSGLEASVIATDTPTLTFVANNNRLALLLHTRLSPQYRRGNMVNSPLAVASSLGMLYLGARGQTADQIDAVLGIDKMNTFNPHVGFYKFLQYVNRLTPGDSSAICNVMLKDKTKSNIFDGYVRILQRFYNPSIDVRSNMSLGSALLKEEINQCLSLASNQSLANVVKDKDPMINAQGSLITVSATYFNLSVSQRLDSTLTEMPFLRFPSAERKVLLTPGLKVTGRLQVGYSSQINAIVTSLPLSGQQLQLVLVMPGSESSFSANGLSEMEASMNEQKWSALLRATVVRPAVIKLPIISHRTTADLKESLFRMGIRAATEADRADFSGVNGVRDLTLGSFVQMTEFHLGPSEVLHQYAHANDASHNTKHGDHHHGEHHDSHHEDHHHHGEHHEKHSGKHHSDHIDHRINLRVDVDSERNPDLENNDADSSQQIEQRSKITKLVKSSGDSLLKKLTNSRRKRSTWQAGGELLPWEVVPQQLDTIDQLENEDYVELLSRQELVEVNFERAFMYVLRHKSTGAILLSGRYLDPHQFV